MAANLHPIFIMEEAVKLVGFVDAHGHSLIPRQILYSCSVDRKSVV